MKNTRKNPRRLNFSTRVMIYLLIAYLLMAILFGGVYFTNVREITEKRVIEQIANFSVRTQDDFNVLINQVEELYLDLLFDEELYDILINYESETDNQPQTIKKVQAILRSDLRNLDDIRSVQIMSDQYVFYNSNVTYTSIYNVNESSMYHAARQSSHAFWTSAYDFTKEYGHSGLEDLDLPIRERNLVSYVGPFNGFRIQNNTLQIWPSSAEKPVVCISISTDTLAEYFNEEHCPYGGKCFLIDAEGICIADGDGSMFYQNIEESIFTRINANRYETGHFMACFQGEESLIHYAHLSNGWTLMTVLHSDEVFAEIYGIIWNTLVVMLLITLALCMLLAFVVSRSLALPLRRLLQAIQLTGGGNFRVALQPTGDEFDEVNAAFTEMNCRINALIQENYESKLRERDNELRALKYQTKPHFLYNTLTVIRLAAMKHEDTEVASMLFNLSNVLRYVLRGDQDLVTVRDEINNVMDYFDLMRAGYDDAIALEIDVEPSILNAAICKMTLQPLVENSVQHGLADRVSEKRGRVQVKGFVRGANIVLIVSDNGTGWPKDFMLSDQEGIDDEHSDESIGLNNVRRRMKLIFGEACSMRIYNAEQGGAVVEIVFPYQFACSSTLHR